VQKLEEGDKSINQAAVSPNYWGNATNLYIWEFIPPIHRFVITDIRCGRKKKRTEVKGQIMTLYHAKVGEKHNVPPP